MRFDSSVISFCLYSVSRASTVASTSQSSTSTTTSPVTSTTTKRSVTSNEVLSSENKCHKSKNTAVDSSVL